MAEHDWSTKLAPLLSVLDGIRPDAAKALRDVIDKTPEHLHNTNSSLECVSDYLMSHVHWKGTPQGSEFWVAVHDELEQYDYVWFGEE